MHDLSFCQLLGHSWAIAISDSAVCHLQEMLAPDHTSSNALRMISSIIDTQLIFIRRNWSGHRACYKAHQGLDFFAPSVKQPLHLIGEVTTME